MRRWAALLLCVAASPTWAADIVFENARCRAVLGPDATWRSLVDKAARRERIIQPRVARVFARGRM